MAQVYEHDRKTEDIINYVLGEPAGNGYCQREAAYPLLCLEERTRKKPPLSASYRKGRPARLSLVKSAPCGARTHDLRIKSP